MKKTALLTAMCSTLIVSLPVDATPQITVTSGDATSTQSTTVVPAPPAVSSTTKVTDTPSGTQTVTPHVPDVESIVKHTPILRVNEVVAKEILVPYSMKPVTKASLNRFVDFQFSAAAQADFKEMFGNPDPLHFGLRDLPNGDVELTFLMQSLDYKDTQFNTLSHWEPMSGQVTYSKDLKHFVSSADWPYFSQGFGNDASVEFKKMHLTQDATYNKHFLALGKAHFSMSEVNFHFGEADTMGYVRGVELNSNVTQQGPLLSMDITSGVDEVLVGGQMIGPIRFDYSILNINEAPAAELLRQLVDLTRNTPAFDQRVVASKKIFDTKLLPVISPNSRFEIKELSVVYQALKAVLKGAVWLDHPKKQDMSSPALLLKKIAAHVELTMPKALALKITKLVSSLKPGPDAEQQTNAGLQALIAAGMIKEENDQLSVVFDYANGMKKVNGHDINDKPKK